MRCWQVVVVRDPSNKMDPNAIKVARIGEEGAGATLGYLTRDVARQLAPMMDSQGVRVVARCASQARG